MVSIRIQCMGTIELDVQSITLRLENADGIVSAPQPVSADWERICVSGEHRG